MSKHPDAETLIKQAGPLTHQEGREIQPFGHLVAAPIALAESVRQTTVDNLTQLLADTITLHDLYKKHHWQASGPTFHPLHLLFDKHRRSRPAGSTCWPSGSRRWAA